ncbi:hypothetical protein IMSAG049_00792 [Clostridiales bacterium]|nr:hypothetical protein IMSAG049_00792 [Clostridiales bacterium]
MSEVQSVSFWLVYSIVITIISGMYIYWVNKEADAEREREEKYKKRLEEMEAKGCDKT